MRRLRKTGLLRGLVRETELSAAHLVYPMFVRHGLDGRVPIPSMPGIDHLSISAAVEEAGEAAALGIPAVLLFGLPGREGRGGLGRLGRRGHRPARDRARSRRAHPDLARDRPTCASASTPTTATAACCATTACVDNDATLELLARTAVSPRRGRRRRRRAERHDGRAGRRASARRSTSEGFEHDADPVVRGEVRIGVLRPVPRGGRVRAPAAATGAATRWTRRTRARRCARSTLDVAEGADMVMVKPALPYLDVIRAVAERDRPAGRRLQRQRRVRDAQGGRASRAGSTSVARSSRRSPRSAAPAPTSILTYHAKDVAGWLR